MGGFGKPMREHDQAGHPTSWKAPFFASQILCGKIEGHLDDARCQAGFG